MFLEQWKALSARIHGLVKAGQTHASYLMVKSADSYGTAKHLRTQGLRILEGLEKFRNSFQDLLLPSALTAINDCVSKDVDGSVGKLLSDETGGPNSRKERVWAALVMLAAFETEMTFILSDVQSAIRARSERAFAHLQRLIVVDAATGEQWRAAHKTGEVACEKLGAVHLLWHGIWAFKVVGAGERTDLVYQQVVDGVDVEQRFADGLVLTEWKVASSDAEAQRKFKDARHQAACYAKGVLAGNELTAFRYLIVVSAERITEPKDIKAEKEVVYRHINIAVDPMTPSRSRRPLHSGVCD